MNFSTGFLWRECRFLDVRSPGVDKWQKPLACLFLGIFSECVRFIFPLHFSMTWLRNSCLRRGDISIIRLNRS
jgi:hypothetical protein